MQGGIGVSNQIQGKKLSYNNINDTDAALELVNEFPQNEGAAAVIVKHANPCGVGVANSMVEAIGLHLAAIRLQLLEVSLPKLL